jgi:hypothetical protein
MMPRFTEGCDYEIVYLIPGVHRKPRIARMGYLGTDATGHLIFDARGPDRRTGGQYAGTQQMTRSWMLAAKGVVERDRAKRYASRRYHGPPAKGVASP